MSNSNKRSLNNFINKIKEIQSDENSINSSFTFFDNKKDTVSIDTIKLDASNKQTYEITHEEGKASKVIIGYEDKLTNDNNISISPIKVICDDGPNQEYTFEHINDSIDNHSNQIEDIKDKISEIDENAANIEKNKLSINKIVNRLKVIDGKGIEENNWNSLKEGYTNRENPKSYEEENADIPYIHNRINSFFNYVDYESLRNSYNPTHEDEVGLMASVRIDPNQMKYSRIKNIFTFDLVFNNDSTWYDRLIQNQWVKMVIHQRKPNWYLCEYIGISVNPIQINITDENILNSDRFCNNTNKAVNTLKKRFIFENLVIDPNKITYFTLIPSDVDNKGNKINSYEFTTTTGITCTITPDIENNKLTKDILLNSTGYGFDNTIFDGFTSTPEILLNQIAQCRIPTTKLTYTENGIEKKVIDYIQSDEPGDKTSFHAAYGNFSGVHEQSHTTNLENIPWINIGSCRLSSSKEGGESHSDGDGTKGTHGFIDLTLYPEAREFFTETKASYVANNNYYYLLPNTINYFGKITGGSVSNLDGSIDLSKVKWNNSEIRQTNNLIDRTVKSTKDTYSTAEIHFYADKYSTVIWPLDNFTLLNSDVPDFSTLGDREIYVTAQLFYIPNSDNHNAKLRILYQAEIDDIEEERNEYNRHIFYTSIPELIENGNVRNSIFNNNKISFLLKPNVTYELGTLNTPYYCNSYDANGVPQINTVDLSGLHFNDEEDATIDISTFYLHGADKDPSSPIYNIPPVPNEEISKCELSFTLFKGVNIIWPTNWIWDETTENIPGRVLDDNNEPIRNNLYDSHITIEVEYTPKVIRGTYIVSEAQYRARVKHFEPIKRTENVPGAFISRSIPTVHEFFNYQSVNGALKTAVNNNHGFAMMKPALDYININILSEINIELDNKSSNIIIPNTVNLESPENDYQIAIYRQTDTNYEFVGASTNRGIKAKSAGIKTFKFNNLDLKETLNLLNDKKLIFIFRQFSDNTENIEGNSIIVCNNDNKATTLNDPKAALMISYKSYFLGNENSSLPIQRDFEHGIGGSAVGTTNYFPHCSFAGYKIP